MGNRLITTLPSLFEPIQEKLDIVHNLILSELNGCQPDVFDILQRTIFIGGKRIRPAIVLLIGNALQGPQEKLIRLAAAIEMLHNATLIHDDLIDHAAIRHHQPTLHTRHSTQLTILIGDYLFAHAAKIAAEIDSPEAAKMFATTLITIVDGEINQYSEDKFKPDLIRYEKRIYQKTASLFESSAFIAANLCSTDHRILAAMQKFGYHTGMAFQMMDDVLDCVGDENILGKPIGSDLRQGLLNLPTILYLANQPESPYRDSILGGSSFKDEDYGNKILAAIRNSSAIDKSLQKINQHLIAGQKQLTILPESRDRQRLQEIIHYLSKRVL